VSVAMPLASRAGSIDMAWSSVPSPNWRARSTDQTEGPGCRSGPTTPRGRRVGSGRFLRKHYRESDPGRIVPIGTSSTGLGRRPVPPYFDACGGGRPSLLPLELRNRGRRRIKLLHPAPARRDERGASRAPAHPSRPPIPASTPPTTRTRVRLTRSVGACVVTITPGSWILVGSWRRTRAQPWPAARRAGRCPGWPGRPLTPRRRQKRCGLALGRQLEDPRTVRVHPQVDPAEHRQVVQHEVHEPAQAVRERARDDRT
jgi:hypothetical protein